METVVYSTKNCSVCMQLKAFLQDRGVEYDEVDMGSAAGLAELRCEDIFTITAPVLRVDKIFYEKREFFDEGKKKIVNLESAIHGK